MTEAVLASLLIVVAMMSTLSTMAKLETVLRTRNAEGIPLSVVTTFAFHLFSFGPIWKPSNDLDPPGTRVSRLRQRANIQTDVKYGHRPIVKRFS